MIKGLEIDSKVWIRSTGEQINIFDMTNKELILVCRELNKKFLVIPYEVAREVSYRSLKELI